MRNRAAIWVLYVAQNIRVPVQDVKERMKKFEKSQLCIYMHQICKKIPKMLRIKRKLENKKEIIFKMDESEIKKKEIK